MVCDKIEYECALNAISDNCDFLDDVADGDTYGGEVPEEERMAIRRISASIKGLVMLIKKLRSE